MLIFVWYVLFLAVIFNSSAGGVIVASIVGLVGNRLMSEGTRDFMDTITQTADDIQTQERSITLKLAKLDPSLDFT